MMGFVGSQIANCSSKKSAKSDSLPGGWKVANRSIVVTPTPEPVLTEEEDSEGDGEELTLLSGNASGFIRRPRGTAWDMPGDKHIGTTKIGSEDDESWLDPRQRQREKHAQQRGMGGPEIELNH